MVSFPSEPSFSSSPTNPNNSISSALPLPDPPPQPIPPAPEPPPPSSIPSIPPPQNVQSIRRWTSLFENKPKNAGIFSPPPISLRFSGKNLLPDDSIYEAGREVWRDYLVGFFLDAPLSFTAVSSYLQYLWKPIGGIKIKSTGKVFFFLFSNPEDRRRILNSDPVFIRSKLFIVKPWDCNVGSNSIKTVPVWIKLSNIPLYAWSKPGICWLATVIGKCLCMDAATESLDKLSFAKCLVEITPSSALPNDFPVLLPDGSIQNVLVEYVWKPQICNTCKAFGHSTDKCMNSETIVNNIRSEKPGVSTRGSFRGGITLGNKSATNLVSGNYMKEGIRKETWYKVVNKNKNFDKQTAEDFGAAISSVETGNKFGSLVELIEENSQHLEEGELLTESIVCTKANDVTGTVAVSFNECDQEMNKCKSIDKGKQISSQMVSGVEPTQGMSSKEIVIFNDMNTGNHDVDIPHNIPNVQVDTVCNFKPGFLLQTSLMTNHEKGNDMIYSMQTLIDEVRNYESQVTNEGTSSQSMSDVRNNGLLGGLELTEGCINKELKSLPPEAQLSEQLDSFLKHNFNISVESMMNPQVKDKRKTVQKDKTIVETIECLRDEIESGTLSSELKEIKRQVLENLIKNHNADKVKLPNPYANIPPPPGFKAPPTSSFGDLTSSFPSSSACNSSPVTRSMLKAKTKMLYDNGYIEYAVGY